MKTKRLLRSFILMLAAAFAANTVRAGSQYFDESGGNWSDSKWSSSSTGGSDGAWTAGNDAYFCSTPYQNNTMTIANNTSALSVGAFHTTGTGNITINGTGSFTWTTAGEAFAINAGSTLEIDNVMNGNGNAFLSFQSGTGTLILKGVNTWDSYSIIDSGGTVNIYNNQSLGQSASSADANLFVGGASTLGFYGGSTITLHQGLGTYQPSSILPYVIFAGNTVAKISPVSLDCTADALSGYNGTHYSQFTCNGSADVIFDGTVSDNGGGFQLYGTGRLVMAGGSSTYTGWTDMTGGKLAIGASPNALGASGNHRSTLAFDNSSVTGCYVGSYGGNQTVSSGQPSIYMYKNGSFNNTNTLTFNATYALDVGNAASSSLGLYNTADVIISGEVISANGLGGTTSSGSGTTGGIHLTGPGRIVFQNTASTYMGDTALDTGNLKVTGASGTPTGAGTVQINSSGTLTGTGLAGKVSVNSGGAIVPGDFPNNLGPANLNTGNLTFAGGGHYFWEINNATGTAGVNWSTITCGALSITASSGSPFIIDVTLLTAANGVGLPANFNPATSYSWTIASASSITGFSASAFAFTCSAGPASAFSVSQSGNNLVLNYTPPAIPGVVTTLYNTGLGAGGALLAPGGGTDAHWTLTVSPDATYTGPNLLAVQNTSATWNVWKSAPYSWDISPRADEGNVAAGNYTYSTSFDLTGFNPLQVVISGRFSADDSVASISINGVPTGISGGSLSAWTSFTIPDGLVNGANRVVFLPGANNVQVVVNNAGSSANPSGFNMQWSAWEVPIVPPTILTQTVNGFNFTSGGSFNVTPSSTATFVATATATDPMNYQWTLNGSPLSDSTTSDGAVISGSSGTLAGPGQSTVTMTIANFGLAESGTYSCLFSNVDGTANTAGVLVQPASAPVIITNPVSVTVGLGTNSSFSTLVVGPSLAYQWNHNSAPMSDDGRISGSSAAVLNIPGSRDSDAGTYVCTITNSYGSTNTIPVTLTIIDPPVISVVPTNQLGVIMTSNAAFHVVATGTSPFAYQWYWNGNKVKNGGRIAGATSPDLIFTGVAWDAGTYTVTISNFAGIVTSSPVVLTLNPNFVYESFEEFALGDLDVNGTTNNTVPNPWFGPGPPNLRVVGAEHNVNPQLGAQMLRGAYNQYNGEYGDENWLNLNYRMGLGTNLFGNFVTDWWFYDPAGPGNTNYNDFCALSEYANVPTTSDYGSAGNIGNIGYVSGGQRLSLGAYSSQAGLNATYYQARIVGASDGATTTGWYNLTGLTRSLGWHHARVVMGVPNGASTQASFFIDNMAVPLLTDAITTTTGFNLFEFNAAGGAVTGWYDDLAIRVASDPWIIEQPASVAVQSGQEGIFYIVANGASYQWKKNGADIGGATTATYFDSDVATYTCVVTGTGGSVESAPAVLSVADSLSTGSGLQGVYYNDTTVGTNDPAGAVCTVIDPQVYFNGNALPSIPPSCPSIYGTNFSIHWTGLIQPPVSDTYTFYTMTDDGVRLWVNGQLVINHWVPQAPTEWWSTGIPLQAGQFYAVEMEYYQATGGDYYSLSWASDNVAKQLVPQSALFPYGLAPVIVTDVQPQYGNPGDTVFFTVVAGGASPLSYQWFLNDTNGVNQAIQSPSATTPTLELDNVQPADGLNYYFVVVANAYGSTNSSIANLLVNGAPNPVIVPHSQTGVIGSNVTFTARASGSPAYGGPPWFNYQWYFNDGTIDGATDATLTLTNLQTSNAGNYSVDVAGGGGDTTSDYAYLTVVPPPVLVTPVHISGIANGTLSYSGGAGSRFVLLGTNNVSAPLVNWARLATNSSSPGSFTVSPGSGRTFFRIKSE